MKMSVQFKGIKEAAGKLEPKDLYWPQAKDALHDIGRIGTDELQRTAPHGRTGRLRTGLSYKVNDIPKPLWVVFKTDATATPENAGARGGKSKYPFSYPRMLEFAKTLGRRSHNPNPHQHWLRDGIRKARPKFRSAINKCAAKIEADWGKT